MKKILAVSDVHAPYHNQKAIDATLGVIAKEKPDYLINLGDMVDLDIVSKFRKTSEGYAEGSTILTQVQSAVGIMETMMQTARKANKKCKGVYIEGNHEKRLNDYMRKRREILGIFDIEKLLKLKETGYRHVRYGEDYFLDGYLFCHGYYACVNAGKKHLDMIKNSVVFGHIHSPSTYVGAARGNRPKAYGVGCLCNLDMDYLNGKPTNWVNSVGLLEGKQFRHIVL